MGFALIIATPCLKHLSMQNIALQRALNVYSSFLGILRAEELILNNSFVHQNILYETLINIQHM
jgi:hypothetical protein